MTILAAALPVQAGNDEVRIVNEDGTVSVFKIPAQQQEDVYISAPAPAPVRKVEKELIEEAVKAVLAEDVNESAEEEVEEDDVEEVAVEKTQPVPEEKTIDVVKDEAIKKEKAAATTQPKTRPKADAVIAAATSRMPPFPARKPPVPKTKIYKAHAKPAPGKTISKNTAIGIAIDYAPPASDFLVQGKMHKDKPVYAVTFKTEKGPYEVLVDAYSGKVIRK